MFTLQPTQQPNLINIKFNSAITFNNEIFAAKGTQYKRPFYFDRGKSNQLILLSPPLFFTCKVDNRGTAS